MERVNVKEKIGVYLMPGLAASPEIFEHLKLPETHFEITFLEWFVPDRGMDLRQYALKMCENIRHEHPVLIGVSFGGMLVQEMAEILEPAKTIIISSIKCRSEMPSRMVWARRTGIHHALPTGLLSNVEVLARYTMGGRVKKRLKLYEKYLAVREKEYLNWAIDQAIHWSREEPIPGLIHLHGDKDAVFPISRIGNCQTIPGGTHTMIIHRARWFNERLPAIILQE